MNILGPVEKEKYEQIAHMKRYGVPQNQIAEAVGLSEGRISQIMQDPNYLQISEKVHSEEWNKNVTLDSGWDAVEDMALATVVSTLQFSKDPDYALRAAVLANKANRRKASPGNQPIQAFRAGPVAVINLPTYVVQNAQNLGKQLENMPTQNRISDMVNPGQLQRIVDEHEKERIPEWWTSEQKAIA